MAKKIIVTGGGTVSGSRADYIAKSKVGELSQRERRLFNSVENNLSRTQAGNFLGGNWKPQDGELTELIFSMNKKDFGNFGDTLDEQISEMEDVVREGLDNLWKELGVKNVRWVAGVHLNTNNPHAHIVFMRDARNIETDDLKLIPKIPRNWFYRFNNENSKLGSIFESAVANHTKALPPESVLTRLPNENIFLPAKEFDNERIGKNLNRLSEVNHISPNIVEQLTDNRSLYVSRQGALTFLRRDVEGKTTGYVYETGYQPEEKNGFFYIGNPKTATRYILVENPKEALSVFELTVHRDLSEVCIVASDKNQPPAAFKEFIQKRSEEQSVRVIWALGLNREGTQEQTYYEEFQKSLLENRNENLPNLELFSWQPKDGFGRNWSNQLQFRNLPGELNGIIKKINSTENNNSLELDLTESKNYEAKIADTFKNISIEKDNDEFIVFQKITDSEKVEIGRYLVSLKDGDFIEQEFSYKDADGNIVGNFTDELEVIAEINNQYAAKLETEFLDSLHNEETESNVLNEKDVSDKADVILETTTQKLSAKEITERLKEIPLEDVMPRLGLYLNYDKERREYVYRDDANIYKIKVKNNLWCDRYDDNRGGRNALNLVMHVEGKSFADARGFLLENFGTEYIPQETKEKAVIRANEEKPKAPFVMPETNENKIPGVFQYLTQERAISEDVVSKMLDEGFIFANNFGSVGFVNQDENGNVKGASWRATKGTKRGDYTGTEKVNAWFYIGDLKTATKFVVVEAPIEAMSYYQLHQDKIDLQNTAIISTATNSVPMSLVNLLEKNAGENAELVVAYNNDPKGQDGALYLLEKIGRFGMLKHKSHFENDLIETNNFSGKVTLEIPKLEDWNEDLKAQREVAFYEADNEHIADEIEIEATETVTNVINEDRGIKNLTITAMEGIIRDENNIERTFPVSFDSITEFNTYLKTYKPERGSYKTDVQIRLTDGTKFENTLLVTNENSSLEHLLKEHNQSLANLKETESYADQHDVIDAQLRVNKRILTTVQTVQANEEKLFSYEENPALLEAETNADYYEPEKIRSIKINVPANLQNFGKAEVLLARDNNDDKFFHIGYRFTIGGKTFESIPDRNNVSFAQGKQSLGMGYATLREAVENHWKENGKPQFNEAELLYQPTEEKFVAKILNKTEKLTRDFYGQEFEPSFSIKPELNQSQINALKQWRILTTGDDYHRIENVFAGTSVESRLKRNVMYNLVSEGLVETKQDGIFTLVKGLQPISKDALKLIGKQEFGKILVNDNYVQESATEYLKIYAAKLKDSALSEDERKFYGKQYEQLKEKASFFQPLTEDALFLNENEISSSNNAGEMRLGENPELDFDLLQKHPLKGVYDLKAHKIHQAFQEAYLSQLPNFAGFEFTFQGRDAKILTTDENGTLEVNFRATGTNGKGKTSSYSLNQLIDDKILSKDAFIKLAKISQIQIQITNELESKNLHTNYRANLANDASYENALGFKINSLHSEGDYVLFNTVEDKIIFTKYEVEQNQEQKIYSFDPKEQKNFNSLPEAIAHLQKREEFFAELKNAEAEKTIAEERQINEPILTEVLTSEKKADEISEVKTQSTDETQAKETDAPKALSVSEYFEQALNNAFKKQKYEFEVIVQNSRENGEFDVFYKNEANATEPKYRIYAPTREFDEWTILKNNYDAVKNPKINDFELTDLSFTTEEKLVNFTTRRIAKDLSLTPNTITPFILPTAQQENRVEKRISKIIYAHKLADKIANSDEFHAILKNEPFMDLHISMDYGTKLLRLTHYYEQNGDLMHDGEMNFKIEKNGKLTLNQTAAGLYGIPSYSYDRAFADIFSKNLLNQGFEKATLVISETKVDEEVFVNTETESLINEEKAVSSVEKSNLSEDEKAIFFEEFKFALKDKGIKEIVKSLDSLSIEDRNFAKLDLTLNNEHSTVDIHRAKLHQIISIEEGNDPRKVQVSLTEKGEILNSFLKTQEVPNNFKADENQLELLRESKIVQAELDQKFADKGLNNPFLVKIEYQNDFLEVGFRDKDNPTNFSGYPDYALWKIDGNRWQIAVGDVIPQTRFEPESFDWLEPEDKQFRSEELLDKLFTNELLPKTNLSSNRQVTDYRYPLALEVEPPTVLRGTISLATEVREILHEGKSIGNNVAFNKMAESHFGGTRAAGTFHARDAYDALELGVNLYLLDQGKNFLERPKSEVLTELNQLLKRLPTQTDRTDEQNLFQQFSTPPTESFAAFSALGLKPNDIVLEPSAGNAGLALWSKLNGNVTHVNEISDRRAGILKIIGFDSINRQDAQFLNDTLNPNIKPTVILMNPPFSSTGGRTRNRTIYGAEHISDALLRLEEGGRLVAIVGEGMSFDKPSFTNWWSEVMTKYNVRANIGVQGEEYAKYGTNFGNQILVIDKTGATPGANFAEKFANVITGDNQKVDNVLETLQKLGAERLSSATDIDLAQEYQNARWEAIGAITGSKVERIEERGYRVVFGQVEPQSDLYYEIGGIVTGNSADRLQNKGLKIEKVKFNNIEFAEHISRKDLQNNPDKIFLFGDNLKQTGFGGQAKEMRGEPNAIGIPTKKAPSNESWAFFNDADYDNHKSALDEAFAKLAKFPPETVLVVPRAGLGTGLADLENKAPKTFAYLQQKLDDIGISQNSNRLPIDKYQQTADLLNEYLRNQGREDITSEVANRESFNLKEVYLEVIKTDIINGNRSKIGEISQGTDQYQYKIGDESNEVYRLEDLGDEVITAVNSYSVQKLSEDIAKSNEFNRNFEKQVLENESKPSLEKQNLEINLDAFAKEKYQELTEIAKSLNSYFTEQKEHLNLKAIEYFEREENSIKGWVNIVSDNYFSQRDERRVFARMYEVDGEYQCFIGDKPAEFIGLEHLSRQLITAKNSNKTDELQLALQTSFNRDDVNLLPSEDLHERNQKSSQLSKTVNFDVSQDLIDFHLEEGHSKINFEGIIQSVENAYSIHLGKSLNYSVKFQTVEGNDVRLLIPINDETTSLIKEGFLQKDAQISTVAFIDPNILANRIAKNKWIPLADVESLTLTGSQKALTNLPPRITEENVQEALDSIKESAETTVAENRMDEVVEPEDLFTDDVTKAALTSFLSDGRSIMEAYQFDVKGFRSHPEVNSAILAGKSFNEIYQEPTLSRIFINKAPFVRLSPDTLTQTELLNSAVNELWNRFEQEESAKNDLPDTQESVNEKVKGLMSLPYDERILELNKPSPELDLFEAKIVEGHGATGYSMGAEMDADWVTSNIATIIIKNGNPDEEKNVVDQLQEVVDKITVVNQDGELLYSYSPRVEPSDVDLTYSHKSEYWRRSFENLRIALDEQNLKNVSLGENFEQDFDRANTIFVSQRFENGKFEDLGIVELDYEKYNFYLAKYDKTNSPAFLKADEHFTKVEGLKLENLVEGIKQNLKGDTTSAETQSAETQSIYPPIDMNIYQKAQNNNPDYYEDEDNFTPEQIRDDYFKETFFLAESVLSLTEVTNTKATSQKAIGERKKNLEKLENDKGNLSFHIIQIENFFGKESELFIRQELEKKDIYLNKNDKVEIFQLGAGHLGNGLTIWNRAERENNDHKTIAHISENGSLTIYGNRELPQQVLEKINSWNKSSISDTQESVNQKVSELMKLPFEERTLFLNSPPETLSLSDAKVITTSSFMGITPDNEEFDEWEVEDERLNVSKFVLTNANQEQEQNILNQINHLGGSKEVVNNGKTVYSFDEDEYNRLNLDYPFPEYYDIEKEQQVIEFAVELANQDEADKLLSTLSKENGFIGGKVTSYKLLEENRSRIQSYFEPASEINLDLTKSIKTRYLDKKCVNKSYVENLPIKPFNDDLNQKSTGIKNERTESNNLGISNANSSGNGTKQPGLFTKTNESDGLNAGNVGGNADLSNEQRGRGESRVETQGTQSGLPFSSIERENEKISQPKSENGANRDDSGSLVATELRFERKTLFLPETIDLKPNELTVYQEQKENLDLIGIETVLLNGKTVGIKTYPTEIKPSDVRPLFIDILNDPEKISKIQKFGNLLNHDSNTQNKVETSPEEIESLLGVGKNTEKREKIGNLGVIEYKPAKLTKGTQHPADIVESASMAAVEPPDIKYTPKLAKEIIEEGKLSSLQLETVIYAGQRHEHKLPNGMRAGYFIGDGTGVGKGRELAGIALDNWNQGRKRVLWLSINYDLVPSTDRDLKDLGADIPLASLDKHSVKTNLNQAVGDGVLFSSYSTLIGKGKDGDTRFDQIVNWLGKDGVIFFDEGHLAKNAVSFGMSEASQRGEAVVDLQIGAKSSPDWRIVYSSATGATELRNMAYMQRLGLWGDGTGFPGGFIEFHNTIDKGGIGAMEMVSRDMKASGMLLSRSLSYRGVDYRQVHHELTPEQEEIYNLSAKAWSSVISTFDQALQQTNANSRAKSFAYSRLWASQQMFYRQLMTALKVPALIAETERVTSEGSEYTDTKTGNTYKVPSQVIVGVIGTGEARTKEQVSKAMQLGIDLDNMDFSPKQILMNVVETGFPTKRYTEQEDPVSGKTIKVPVLDADGKHLESREAMMMRDKLLAELEEKVTLPDNPLDQIVNYFGENAVAEMTGRKRRIIINPETGQREYVKRAREGVAMEKASQDEMLAFQAGRKSVAIISQSASTGISLHSEVKPLVKQYVADGRISEEKGTELLNHWNETKDTESTIKLFNENGVDIYRRVHITLETSWSADTQMQTFGRSHRSNEVLPPEYVLMSTNLGGEKRFLSTIAKRLGSLGALTKGDRDQAGGGNLLDFDFENKYGTEAAKKIVTQLRDDDAKLMTLLPLHFETGEEQSGIKMLYTMGIARRNGAAFEVPEKTIEDLEVSRFLNRVLMLDVKTQNAVFDAFTSEMAKIVQHDKELGLFDEGVKDIEGENIRFANEPQTVSKDKATGANTVYYQINADTPTHPVTLQEISSRNQVIRFGDTIISNETNQGVFYQQTTSKNLIYVEKVTARVDAASGRMKDYFRFARPSGWQSNLLSEDELTQKYAPVLLDQVREFRDEERIKVADKWNEEVANTPTTQVHKYHIIGGAVLPVWQRLSSSNEAGNQMSLKTVRIETEEGERVVGVQIPANHIKRVLRDLGVQQSYKTPEEIFDATIETKESVDLVGNIKLRPTFLKKQPTIEVMNLSHFQKNEFQNLGALKEIQNFDAKIFIPTEREKGIEVLTKILERYPAVDKNTQTTPQKVEEETVQDKTSDKSLTDKLKEKIDNLTGNGGLPDGLLAKTVDDQSKPFAQMAKTLEKQPLANYWWMMKAEINDKNQVVINPATYELVRATYKYSFGVDVKNFDGLFHDENKTEKFFETLDRKISQGGIYAESIANVTKTLADGRDRNNGLLVLLTDEKAAGHEDLHVASHVASLGKSLEERHARFDELKNHEAYIQAKPILTKTYNTANDGVLVEELWNWSASGDAAKLNLTKEQAGDFVKLWFTSFAERNGTITKEQFKEMTEDAREIRDTAYRLVATENVQRGLSETDGITETGRTMGNVSEQSARIGSGDNQTQSGNNRVNEGNLLYKLDEQIEENESPKDKLFTEFEKWFKASNLEKILEAKDGAVHFETVGAHPAHYEIEIINDQISFKSFEIQDEKSNQMREDSGILFNRDEKGNFKYAGSTNYIENPDETFDNENTAKFDIDSWKDNKIIATKIYLAPELEKVVQEGSQKTLEDALANQLGEQILNEIKVKEAKYNLERFNQNWKEEKLSVEVEQNDERKTRLISLKTLELEQVAFAKSEVANAKKTGILKMSAEDDKISLEDAEKRIFAKSVKTAQEFQKPWKESLEIKLEEKQTALTTNINSAQTLHKWANEETEAIKRQAGTGETENIKPNLKPETIWLEQIKAVKRGDVETFAKLEELHQEKQIPRPNDVYSRLQAQQLISSLNARKEARQYYEWTGEKAENQKYVVELKKDGDELKVNSLKLVEIKEQHQELVETHNDARRNAEREQSEGNRALMQPLINKINPFSPVNGTLAWFTKPKQTLNIHFNPIEIIKNDPGVQIIRAVYGFVVHSYKAQQLEKVAKQAAQEANLLREQLAPDSVKNAQEMAEIVKKSVNSEETLRSNLKENPMTNADLLKTPERILTDDEIKEVGKLAQTVGDKDLVEKYTKVLADDPKFAAKIGEAGERAIAKTLLSETEIANLSNQAIEQIALKGESVEVEISPGVYDQIKAKLETNEAMNDFRQTKIGNLNPQPRLTLEETVDFDEMVQPLKNQNLERMSDDSFEKHGKEIAQTMETPLNEAEKELLNQAKFSQEIQERFAEIQQSEISGDKLYQQAQQANINQIPFQNTGQNLTVKNPSESLEAQEREFWKQSRTQTEQTISQMENRNKYEEIQDDELAEIEDAEALEEMEAVETEEILLLA